MARIKIVAKTNRIGVNAGVKNSFKVNIKPFVGGNVTANKLESSNHVLSKQPNNALSVDGDGLFLHKNKIEGVTICDVFGNPIALAGAIK